MGNLEDQESSRYFREVAMSFVVNGLGRNTIMNATQAIDEAKKIAKWIREGDPKPEDDSDNSD